MLISFSCLNRTINLDSYNPSGVITIKAFRDSSYPFNAGYWNKYKRPKLATIENVAGDIPRTLRIGQLADYENSYV